MSLTTITSPSQKEEGVKTRTKVFFVMVLLVAFVGGIVGVSTHLVAPAEEIDATKTEIERARAINAEHHEPELFQKAESDFQSALITVEEQNQKLKLMRSYNKAEKLLASAKEAAREAYEGAAFKQKEARAADAAMDLARIEIKAASNFLKWESDKFRPADVRAMEKILEVLEAELKDAERQFNEQDYSGAKSKAMSINQQINEISGKIREAT